MLILKMGSIITGIKRVFRTEAPISSVKIDPKAKQAILAKGMPPISNPFDENALEADTTLRSTLVELSCKDANK